MLELLIVALLVVLVAAAVLAARVVGLERAIARERARLRLALLDLAHAKDVVDLKGDSVEDLAEELERRGILGAATRVAPDRASRR